ncbi:MAG: hypothetical protein SOH95_05525 [Bifidobacterium crudilactis]|jgi:plastocyanin
MTQSAWPFSGQTVSEAQFRAWARQAFGSSVYQGLTVTASTTGRQLQVTAGLAVVDGCAYMSDSTVTLDVDANTTGLARRVYAVLRLDPQATPRIQLVSVNGPAGGGEASFTQTDTGIYEFPLAYVTVTAGQAGGWSSSTSAVTTVAVPSNRNGVVATATDGNGFVTVSLPKDTPAPKAVMITAGPVTGIGVTANQVLFHPTLWSVDPGEFKVRFYRDDKHDWLTDRQVVVFTWQAIWQ